MKAIDIERTGGPDVLQFVTTPDPVAGPGQILIRQDAIGLNFIDIYRRTGLYPVALPARLGSEGSGVVEALGAGVDRFRVGDRVAYAHGLGAYAEAIALDADRAVKLPDYISSRIAAAAMLKGMTAGFLTTIWPLAAGDTVLLHAAAGGVGVILAQWLKRLGVRVIGAVGSREKVEIAAAHGCDHVLVYGGDGDLAKAVRDLTGGAGVKVVYDSVGKDTFEASLGSVAKRGLFVSYGNASGPVPPFAPLRLSQAGSIFFTRPTLFDYIVATEDLDRAAEALFAVIRSGAVKIEIGQEWPLTDVAKAHEALESRQTRGASLLIP